MNNQGIENLLELHESIIDQENGFWVKIEAWEVPRSVNIPHGIRYSLTLHDPKGNRILGYDNAHAVKGRRYSGQKLTFDHRHRHLGDFGVPYTFSSAYELLSDFFLDVDMVLKKVKDK